MCQKVQAAGERLSRRALLKGLGMGAGLVAVSGLSGCTQFLQRSESSVPLAPTGAGGKAARKRLAQLAREAKDSWKEVLRDYNQWRRTGDEKIKLGLPGKIRRAKTSSLTIVDGLDAESLTRELNEKLAKADFNSVSEAERAKAVRTIVQDLSDTGFAGLSLAVWGIFCGRHPLSCPSGGGGGDPGS